MYNNYLDESAAVQKEIDQKWVCIISARCNSSRLPGKSMKMMNNKPMIQHVITRCKKSRIVDTVVVATSTNSKDDVLFDLCTTLNVPCFRGSENNVLERYYLCASKYKACNIVRVCGDCPLMDAFIIDDMIKKFDKKGYMEPLYHGTVKYGQSNLSGFPDGFNCNIFTFEVLKRAYENATDKIEHEHVIPYMRSNENVQLYDVPVPMGMNTLHKLHLSVDTQEDFDRCETILKALSNDCSYMDILLFLKGD